jgi:hypothetical protein
MPKIPLTNISMAPELRGGVNVPQTGLISDALGKAIQGAAIDTMQGSIAAARGEMEKGQAIAGLGKNIANVAGAFAALQDREKKLDSLETRLAFDQDLQRHYLTREEFEFANSENPILNGKNQYTEFAIKGIADLRKKYGELELDPNTAGYIAGQLSEHTIKSPAEARINSIRQRGINFNNQFKTSLEGNNFDAAFNINQSAFENGLINETQFNANQQTVTDQRVSFVRKSGEEEIGALLLDNNIAAADESFKRLQIEGNYTDQEKAYNQSYYDNKKANVVVYNTTLNNALENPSDELRRVMAETERRQQPGWREDPKDPTGLGRLDNIQLESLKKNIGEAVKIKANEQLGNVLRSLPDSPAGETQDEFNKRIKTEAPELYAYDDGAITSFLYDFKQSGKQAQGGITGYFLDKINEIDFEDQSAGAMQERGMLMDAIEEFTDGGVQDELKNQWSKREKLHTDPATNAQVKSMEGMVDTFVDSLPMPDIDVQVEAKPARTPWYKFGFGEKTVPPVMGRPGRIEKQEIYDADGNLLSEKEVFVAEKDKTKEQIVIEERKTLSNSIKAQLRENAATGKYTKSDGTFNTELFRNDFNLIITDIAPLPATGATVPSPTLPGDESDNITPETRAAREAGANIPIPQPEMPVPVPVPSPEPQAFNLPPVEQLEEVFNPEQQTTPTMTAGNFKFNVVNKTRDQLESTSSTIGNRIVSLDYNSSSGGANYAMIVIPNDATAEEREAAKLYVDTVTDWFRSNGIQVGDPIVKTTSENGRGVGGFFHTEPAFVQNRAAMGLLQEKAGEYANIVANTLGALPGTTFIPPHKSNDPGAGAPGILGERDFAKTYILPELAKIQQGVQTQMSQGVQTKMQQGEPITITASAYSPKRGASNVSGAGGEGGYEASRPGPDGKAIVRTLDDVLTGQSDYITIAGNPELYGKEYIIPEIPYTDKQGVRHILTNVRAVVHDTGSAFNEAPEGRFDIPVARDVGTETMAANHASWKGIQFIPLEG